MRNREIILSSGRQNRKGYTIPVSKIDISDYMPNPVLLAEHEYDKNIGHVSDLRFENGKLKGKLNFSSNDLGREYEKLYEEKAINAVSMGGFVSFADAARSVANSFILYENSLTSVPADPGAVAADGAQENTNATYSEEVPEQLSAIAKEKEGYEYVTLSFDFLEDESQDFNNNENNNNLNVPKMANENELNPAVTVENPQAKEPEQKLSAAPAPEPKAEPKPEPEKLAQGQKVLDTQRIAFVRESLSELVKDGEKVVNEQLHFGSDEAKLNIIDAIGRTELGKLFFERTKLNFKNNGADYATNVNEYLSNRESLSSELSERQRMANAHLNASTDFVDSPSLDKVAFAAMMFLKLFPSNRWTERIPVLPVDNIVNGVGTIFANVGFDNNVDIRRASTNSSVTAATIVSKADTARQIAVWEYALEPMLFRRYNRDIVGYDQFGAQWNVATQNLVNKQMDWELYQLAVLINAVAARRYPTTGAESTPGALWPKIPTQATAYKALSLGDVFSLEALLRSQNIDIDATAPVAALDPWMLKALQSDSTITSLLTRWVTGTNVEGLNLSVSKILSRSYLGVYNTAANAVLNPSTGTATADMQQYGLHFIPEYVLRGFGGLEIYSKIEPSLYGEVYSAQLKSGITTAYADAKGCSLIIPGAAEVVGG